MMEAKGPAPVPTTALSATECGSSVTGVSRALDDAGKRSAELRLKMISGDLTDAEQEELGRLESSLHTLSGAVRAEGPEAVVKDVLLCAFGFEPVELSFRKNERPFLSRGDLDRARPFASLTPQQFVEGFVSKLVDQFEIDDLKIANQVLELATYADLRYETRSVDGNGKERVVTHELLIGYVPVRRCALDPGYRRVPRSLVIRANATLSVARQRQQGLHPCIIEGAQAEAVPDVDRDEGPYRYLLDDEISDMLYAGVPDASKNELKLFVDYRTSLLERFSTSALDPASVDEIPIRRGVYDYRTDIVRPYDFERDRRVGKFAGIDFATENPDGTGRVLDWGGSPAFTMADGSTITFDALFEQIMPDPLGREAVLRCVSAILRPQVNWERAFIWLGLTGRNGKGTLMTIIERMCGAGESPFVSSYSLDKFAERFFLPDLRGKLLNLSPESNVKGFLGDTSNLKAVITHDSLSERRIYGAPVTFRLCLSLLFNLNSDISSAEHTDALYRRFEVIPFREAFYGREDSTVKEVFCRRRDVASYFAYLALLKTEKFFGRFPENDYVRRGNFEHRLMADPTFAAAEGVWPSIEECGLVALPGAEFYEVLKAWLKREKPRGSISSFRSSEFRNALNEYLSKRGWVVARVPGESDFAQLACHDWLDDEASEKLVKMWSAIDRRSVYKADLGHSVERVVFRNGALATWVAGGEYHGGSSRPKRPRYWLVRADVWKRYLDEGVTPRQAREDERLGARAAVSKTAESTVDPRVEYDRVYLPLVARLREKGYAGRTRKTSEPGTHRLLPLAYADWLEAGRPNFAAGDQRRIKTGLAESCFELSEWCGEHDWREEDLGEAMYLTLVGQPVHAKSAAESSDSPSAWREWTSDYRWSYLTRKPLDQILKRDVLKDLERIGGEGDEGPADPPNA